MSFDGSGTFNLPEAPFVYDTVISETAVNSNFSDIATGLSTCLTKDGQTNPTANLPMNSKRFTGLAAGSAATDSVNLGQVQAQAYIWCGTAGGTADAITLSPSPAITAYAAGQTFRWKAGSSANTGAMTVTISGLGTSLAAQSDLAALSAGDHEADAIYEGTLDTTSTIQIRKVALSSGFADPMTTRGDIIVRNSSNATARLAVGAANTVLKSDGTDAAWGDVAVADLADGTDGELITWDASGNPATVSAGSSGQVLTSNGAGAAPTFQAIASGLVPLATATASSDATVDFTTTAGFDGTYDVTELHLINVVPANDGVNAYLRIATAGPTWEADGTDYQYKTVDGLSSGSGVSTTQGTTGSQMQMNNDTLGSDTAESISGIIRIFAPADGASSYVKVTWDLLCDLSAGSIMRNMGGGRFNTAGAVVGIRFLFSAGDVESGAFHLYGAKIPT